MLGREEKVSQLRLTAVQYILLGIFLVLAFGLWRLQVARNDYYNTLAEQNRIKQVPILAPRGKILDREGRIIVDNYPSFSVLLLRDQNRDLMADADNISIGLHIPPDELRARLKRMAAVPGYQPLFLKDDITPDELAFIESHRAELPELDTITVHRRLYPKNGFMAHVIGYVGQVSEDMLTQPQWELYNPGDIVGMSGVEQYYNDVLMGKNGSRQVLVNSRGKEVGTLSDVQAVPGKQLKLTIDLDLQIAAEEALEGKPGAIVAMDPRNGEILAMVSRPAFDPNQFAVHITRDEWNALVTDPGKPLLNKAIQAQLAPGSVFKVIMATAGLQENIAQKLVINCGGGKTFYGRFFKCWIASTHGSHGTVGISKAIYQSCDSYFYTLAEKLGIERIAKYATMLGLGQKSGIDLPQEVSGVMPSEEWKIKNFKQKWYAGETISVGIGQGAVATTPIQLARAIGAITSGGVLVHPHVAFPDQFPPGFKQVSAYSDKVKFPLDQDNWMTITDAMANVVSPMGTAGSARLPGIDFAGKTGSAQTISNDLKKRLGAEGKNYKDNGWFVGVTPRRNPELVVACLFEGGEHGALAARVAAKVIAAYVAKQRRIQTEVAKANAAPGSKQAEVAAVWHEGDAKNPDKLQAGRFVVPAVSATRPVNAAPGVEADEKPIPAADLEATESHAEMARPEAASPTPSEPKPADTRPDAQPAQQVPAKKRIQDSSAPVAPPAVAVPRRQP
ncbi:MAG: penicillin-binding protein 2 [Candidatus Korobacteraceae bacterium]|jgi:penicillin-binding protein 2